MPGVAGALGLGKISSYSGINERFFGIVELKGISAEEIDNVMVSLGSPAEYKRAGLNYPKHAGSLRFTPSRTASGNPIIRISSSEAITDPFLGIVLNVDSPKGFGSKEYMVALEPEPTAFASGEKLVPEGPRNEETSPPNSDGVDRPDPREVTAFPLRHGPVKSKESLLDIATAYSLTGASASQIAMALYRYNQHAFINGDINKLRAGVTLEIPHRDAVMESTKSVANMELQHLIRGEQVVIALPRLVSPSSESPSTDKIASVSNHPPAEKSPSLAEQPGSEKQGEVNLIAGDNREGSQSLTQSIPKPLKYGPVQPGQSLEIVARRLAPAGASLAQTALTLFTYNPKAFISGDIRKLRSGARLSIPDPQSIFALPQEDAKKVYEAALRGQAISSMMAQLVTPPQMERTSDQEVGASQPIPTAEETLESGEKIVAEADSMPKLAMIEDQPNIPDQPANLASDSSSSKDSPNLLSSQDAEHQTSPAPQASPVKAIDADDKSGDTDRLVIAMHSPTVIPPESSVQRIGQIPEEEANSFASSNTLSSIETPLPSNADIQRELLLVREVSEQNHQENLHLRTRIAELETQIASLQKLMLLSTDQINQLVQLVTNNSTLPSPQPANEIPSAQASPTGFSLLAPNLGQSDESTELKILLIFLFIAVLGYYVYYRKFRRFHQVPTTATDLTKPVIPPSSPEIDSTSSRLEATGSPIKSQLSADAPEDELLTDQAKLSKASDIQSLPEMPATGEDNLRDIIPPENAFRPSSDETVSPLDSQLSTSNAIQGYNVPIDSEILVPSSGQRPSVDTHQPINQLYVSMGYSDEAEDKIDLSMAYIQTHRYESAKRLLLEVIVEGNSDQRKLARSMLDRLA